MNIIMYEGSHLNDADLRSITQLTTSPVPVDGVDLNLRVCKTPEELSNAIREMTLQEIQDGERFFPFKSMEGTKLLRLSQVLYFKSCGHRIIAVLTDGQELRGRTLRVPTASFLEPLTRTGNFYQIYRTTFVNKMHIINLGPTWVNLDNGTRLTVARKFYSLLLHEGNGRECNAI